MQKQKTDPERDDIKISPAHEQANKDIKKDPDLNTTPAPEDGLDEGELAKLEGGD